MSTIDHSPCPRCGAVESLALTKALIASRPGTYSLSGTTFKVSAVERPVLSCSACDLRVVGEFDADGHHVTFPPVR